MKYQHPLKKILSQARPYWDQDEMRASVRRVFSEAMQCRTAELGAEVYSSENQELILYHTCKSRACPSCGYRAHVQWLRERWAALPDALYKGITFTMPNQLWPLFRDNPRLAKALSALVACRSEFVTAEAACGVRVFPLDGPSISGVGVDVATEFAS
jgi:Transposase zinc-binding domain